MNQGFQRKTNNRIGPQARRFRRMPPASGGIAVPGWGSQVILARTVAEMNSLTTTTQNIAISITDTCSQRNRFIDE